MAGVKLLFLKSFVNCNVKRLKILPSCVTLFAKR